MKNKMHTILFDKKCILDLADLRNTLTPKIKLFHYYPPKLYSDKIFHEDPRADDVSMLMKNYIRVRHVVGRTSKLSFTECKINANGFIWHYGSERELTSSHYGNIDEHERSFNAQLVTQVKQFIRRLNAFI